MPSGDTMPDSFTAIVCIITTNGIRSFASACDSMIIAKGIKVIVAISFVMKRAKNAGKKISTVAMARRSDILSRILPDMIPKKRQSFSPLTTSMSDRRHNIVL